MKITIDRFEGGFAIVEKEDRTFFDLPLALVPEGAAEGSVLDISIDKETENSRRERIEEKAKRLWAD